MALSANDILKGLDFTGLGATATAADHNVLVDGAAPISDSASEGKGLILWTLDSALDTPIVPNPVAAAEFNKWKRYIWIRIPHSSATVTTAKLYVWNDSATSVATYLKWQLTQFNTADLDAALAALELRVEDLEASIATALATANAANANAATASTNATAALATANTANANALEALSDLNTATTGIKDRVTALETRMTSAESSITAINTQITQINTTLGSGLGPIFIAPVTIYSGSALAYTTYDLSAYIPSNAKAAILEATGYGTGAGAYVTIRKDATSADLILLYLSTFGDLTPSYDMNQGMYPISSTRSLQLFIAAGLNATVRLVGYIV